MFGGASSPSSVHPEPVKGTAGRSPGSRASPRTGCQGPPYICPFTLRLSKGAARSFWFESLTTNGLPGPTLHLSVHPEALEGRRSFAWFESLTTNGLLPGPTLHLSVHPEALEGRWSFAWFESLTTNGLPGPTLHLSVHPEALEGRRSFAWFESLTTNGLLRPTAPCLANQARAGAGAAGGSSARTTRPRSTAQGSRAPRRCSTPGTIFLVEALLQVLVGSHEGGEADSGAYLADEGEVIGGGLAFNCCDGPFLAIFLGHGAEADYGYFEGELAAEGVDARSNMA